MRFSYSWLKQLSGFKGSAEKMAEVLTLHVAEVDEVKKAGKDWVIDVSLPANRVGDLSGHIGLAQEIAAATNVKVKDQNEKLDEEADQKASAVVSVRIENHKDCSRYSARVIEGIKVGPSPTWLQERLKVLGLRPINIIVDLTNFVMLETGQPLHAFDFDKLAGKDTKTIIVRRAKKGEKLLSLDGAGYWLDSDILVIADSKKPVAIAGIKGGADSGIDAKTETIVIESANFDPVVTRKASRKLKLRTDASLRFEHGLDPSMTVAALDRVSKLIAQHAGGTVRGGVADAYPKKSPERIAEFDPAFTEQLLGERIPQDKALAILTSLGFTPLEISPDVTSWLPTRLQRSGFPTGSVPLTVPSVRQDVELREDVVEEVGRMWGYDHIVEKPLEGPYLPGEKDDRLYWQERIRDYLVAAGCTEVQTYSFTNRKMLELFKIPKTEILEIENPVREEYRYLRPSLVPNLLGVVEKNKNEKEDIRLFEIGARFEGGSKIGEDDQLCVLVNLRGDQNSESFLATKGIVDSLFDSLGITDDWIDDVIPEKKTKKWWYQLFHPYRRAEVKVGDALVGLLGEVNPKISKYFEIKGRAALFTASVEALTRLATEEHEYEEFSRFPAVTRDISLLVPSETRVEEVTNIVENAGGKFLADTDLFDIYEGEYLEAEQKSLAFHLAFQAKDRTLTDLEVDKYMNSIQKAINKKGWEKR